MKVKGLAGYLAMLLSRGQTSGEKTESSTTSTNFITILGIGQVPGKTLTGLAYQSLSVLLISGSIRR